MGLLDRLLGRSARPEHPTTPAWGAPARTSSQDEAAVARYRYLLRTAPPEAIEQAHADAFAQLTPDQRRQVLASLGHQLPSTDWARSYDPHSLARIATRAEVRQPGTLERCFGRGVGGTAVGGLLAGSLLASVAGAVIGTAVADALLSEDLDLFTGDELAGDGFSTDPDDLGDFGGDFGGEV